MTPKQRKAALRLADYLEADKWYEAAVLLRELASEQDDTMPGMSLMNRTIAYCAADTLRKLGYEWNGEAWLAAEPAKPESIGAEWKPCVKLPVTVHVREQRPSETHVSTREGLTPVNADDLIMRGVSGEEYPIGRGIFDHTYRLGESAEPVQEPVAYIDPRQLARKAAVLHCITKPEYRSWSDAQAGVEYTPVYLHPPQQREPLTDEQIKAIWWQCESKMRDHDPRYEWWSQFARAIERAHGIESKEK